MFSILNRALSWAIAKFGNKFCLKKRSRLTKALDNRFYIKFMQFEIGLLKHDQKRFIRIPLLNAVTMETMTVRKISTSVLAMYFQVL